MAIDLPPDPTHDEIVLDQDRWDAFAARLDHPPVPSAGMADLLRRPRLTRRRP